MSLQCTGLSLVSFYRSVYAKENVSKASFPFDKPPFKSIYLPRLRFKAGSLRRSSLRASKVEEIFDYNDNKKKGVKESSKSDQSEDDDEDDDFEMDEDERKEFRKKIRQMIEMNPEVKEEADPEEKRKMMQKLLADYPLVVDEDDPDWPEDADGWGFNFSQFFDKMTVKNVKKDVDDDDYDSDKEVNWQDIRAIKDITSAEWEETVFSDLSPLVVLVHNRYRRPKENEMVYEQLEKAIHLIWDCRIPSPRCVAIDAVVECDLVSTLGVSVFPELIFTKTGKILHREKEVRTADELSKIMAFLYYGGAKPACLNTSVIINDAIPGFTAKK
ncbi:hypothetical protein QVD17_09526 [Tagetes erecta]|uniref:Thioredoxin-like fold domain-containing protein MRL7L, chloroplastic n=1 Tax=Tagetes erecta TaxID=13708 RepID=A0AAD8L137_TARER|nr:hypothetical protein QVD17_09526 [Tagetes erecta]